MWNPCPARSPRISLWAKGQRSRLRARGRGEGQGPHAKRVVSQVERLGPAAGAQLHDRVDGARGTPVGGPLEYAGQAADVLLMGGQVVGEPADLGLVPVRDGRVELPDPLRVRLLVRDLHGFAAPAIFRTASSTSRTSGWSLAEAPP